MLLVHREKGFNISNMPASKSSPKTKTYVLLKQPTLLKNKTLSKQGKEIRTSRSPSAWVANYAIAMYSKKYKQIGSMFLYRKGTVYRYNVTFKTKSGRKCATAKLTSRSVCKVTGGKVGKSRSCHPYGTGKSGEKSSSTSHKSLSAKKKSLSKSKSALTKARKALSSAKKRLTKAKVSLCKTKSGTKKRSSAKKKVNKASKTISSAKKAVTKLKSAVKKKTTVLSRAQ